jgi:hypothetical protein
LEFLVHLRTLSHFLSSFPSPHSLSLQIHPQQDELLKKEEFLHVLWKSVEFHLLNFLSIRYDYGSYPFFLKNQFKNPKSKIPILAVLGDACMLISFVGDWKIL